MPRGRPPSRPARRPGRRPSPPRPAARSRRDPRERLPHPSRATASKAADRFQTARPWDSAFARQLVHKFFADRGTHLAAMVAYFALLSFVPLVFLALSLFGLAHRAEASDFFVTELKHAFPGTSLDSIIRLVRRVQDNAAALGIIGGVVLLWSSLSLFSALESALNIVYGLPNRRFLHGKGIAAALMASVARHALRQPRGRRARCERAQAPPRPFADSPALAYARLGRRLARRRLRLPARRLPLAAEHARDLAGGAARRSPRRDRRSRRRSRCCRSSSASPTST